MSEDVVDVVVRKDKSIHPRVVNGRTMFPKKDTSKKKNVDTIRRAIAGIMEHLSMHPSDSMSQRRLKKLEAMI